VNARLVLFLFAVWLAGCAQLVPAPGVEGPVRAPEEAWARVLDRFVDDEGRVDFAGLARDHDDLDRYVAWVYALGPNNRPEAFPSRADVLAHHVNAYNALAMYNVLQAGIPDSLAGLRKVRFFYFRQVSAGGEPISLYDYENRIIRPLGEERVHFALNCMVKGCPRLPRAPFRAETLEAELEREARRFFNESRNVRVDGEAHTVYFSEILRFYTEDFLARAPSLIAYANRYRAEPIPENFCIEFIPYDWRINSVGRL